MPGYLKSNKVNFFIGQVITVELRNEAYVTGKVRLFFPIISNVLFLIKGFFMSKNFQKKTQRGS